MYIKFGKVKPEWRDNFYQSVAERAVEGAILEVESIENRKAWVFDDRCDPTLFRYVDLDKFVSFWIEPKLEYFNN